MRSTVTYINSMSKQPARFDSFQKRAAKLIESPVRVQRLTTQAVQKLASKGSEGVREAKSQVVTAVALLNAWRTGQYTGVSKKTVVVVAAALLYFVVPMDVIPDFLFAWGFVDDIAVLGYVFTQVSDEIEAFKVWQTGQTTQPQSEGLSEGAE